MYRLRLLKQLDHGFETSSEQDVYLCSSVLFSVGKRPCDGWISSLNSPTECLKEIIVPKVNNELELIRRPNPCKMKYS
jgi:hypothetical protein